MTLRLALVIDGDPSGAKKALDETASGIERLGEKAGRAAAPTRDIADGVVAIGAGGGAAADALGKTGDAAGKAAPALNLFKAAASGIAAGLVGGLVGGAAAGAIQLLASAVGGYAKEILGLGQVEDHLKAHADLVGRIKDAYGEASGAASSYGKNSLAILRFQEQQNVARLEGDFADALPRFGGPLGGSGAFADIMQSRLGPFADAMAALRNDLKDGAADVIAFREEIARIAESLPEDSPFRRLAETIFEDTEAAAALQAELARARDLLKGLQGDAEAASTALGGNADKFRAAGEAAAAAVPQLNSYARALAAIAANGGPPSVAAFTGADFIDRPFAAGGFTGHLPENRIAGVVHGREFVFDAAATARIGVGNLEAMRRGVTGYATGGFVGNIPVPTRSPRADNDNEVAATANDFRFLQGALLDFVGALQQGESVGEAFGGVLKQLGQQLLSSGLNAIGNSIFGQGGGGFLSQLFSLFAGGFENGGNIPAGMFGLTGERRPELVFGPASVVPMERLAGGGAMAIHVTVNGARGNAEIEDMVRRGVRSGIAAYDRDAMPGRVNAVLADPRAR